MRIICHPASLVTWKVSVSKCLSIIRSIMQVCIKLFLDCRPSTTIKALGVGFKSSVRFRVWAAS